MAVIVPNSNIRLLSVPFDNTYTHVFTFASETEQYNYFNSLSVYGWGATEYTYIPKDGAVRVAKNADELYNINYIMYQNNIFNIDRWFYGFVKKVEWLSDNSALVYFETDVWQTWQFELIMKDCFVSREHSASLLPVDLMPENIETGEYIQIATMSCGLGDLAIVVATTVTNINAAGEKTGATGKVYGGIYSGCEMIAYDPMSADGVASLNTFLNNLTEHASQDAVVSIYMVPKIMLDNPPSGSGGHPVTSGTVAKKIRVTFPYNDVVGSRFDGYVGRNTKLSSFPYQFIYVHNNNGSSAVYPVEYFGGGITFEISGTILPNPVFKISPVNYKSKLLGSDYNGVNYDESITLSGYPMCQWSYDAFKAWVAQNGANTAIATIGALGAVVGGAVSGNAAVAVGGLLAVGSQIAKVTQAAQQPPQAKGNALSGGANAALKMNDFHISLKTITGDYAKVADNFFTMYGYTCNKVKTPNIFQRPKFNYIKTIDANIMGNIPVEDMVRIKQMFNNGVTFWHDKSVFGNYNTDNYPV